MSIDKNFVDLVNDRISESYYSAKIYKEQIEEGSRVVAIKTVGGKDLIDVEGIVRIKRRTDLLVEFDDNVGGHDGNNVSFTGKDGHCWWCNYDEVIPKNT